MTLLTPTQLEQLEAMVKSKSVTAVIVALASMCRSKADAIRSDQEPIVWTTNEWDRKADWCRILASAMETDEWPQG